MDKIINYFSDIMHETRGIEGLISKNSHDFILKRLIELEDKPLSKVQLNQLLLLNYSTGVSDDFYEFYWHKTPIHFYNIENVEGFDKSYLSSPNIISLKHLKWGLKRIFIDVLFVFGNINYGYNLISDYTYEKLNRLYESLIFNEKKLIRRGDTLDFEFIKKEDRFLISEMANKVYDNIHNDHKMNADELREILIKNLRLAKGKSNDENKILIRKLVEMGGENNVSKYDYSEAQVKLVLDEVIDESVSSETELTKLLDDIAERFYNSRQKALFNTEKYLSLVNDLDVYVATSMRSRNDFINMAFKCENIFKDKRISKFHLRYFDPTISAADSHVDKGLIECLMVKSCKILVYTAGEKDSYGKDAEAAMALSLGKSVIFLCDEHTKKEFYKSVHPLSRLINFQNGVANGVMVTDQIEDVVKLIEGICTNKLQFNISQDSGFYKLTENITSSIVRVQTSNKLLSNSFWSYYNTIY